MSRFIARHLREFPAKTYHREDGSATLGIGILQHGCLAGLVLKNLRELASILHTVFGLSFLRVSIL